MIAGSRMPKEEGDRDKSTRRAPLARPDGPEGSAGPGSRCSSEKDSGYSDGSDWQQTDVEEQQCADVSQSSQSPEALSRRLLQPVFIISHAEQTQERGQLLWRGEASASSGSGSGPARVILVQQPGSVPTRQPPRQPPRRPAKASGRKTSGGFLPILASFAAIAPRPDKSSAGSGPQSPSSRPSTEQLSVSGQAPPTLCGAPPLSPGTGGARRHRFLNTMQVLRQSGLLDITLRTKELLRQSAACQRDVAQLRCHSQLLCRAACGPDGLGACRALHRTMAASGSYPDLRAAQELHFPSGTDPPCQPDSASSADTNGPAAEEGSNSSRAPLLSALLDPGTDPEKFMFPDSSTG